MYLEVVGYDERGPLNPFEVRRDCRASRKPSQSLCPLLEPWVRIILCIIINYSLCSALAPLLQAALHNYNWHRFFFFNMSFLSRAHRKFGSLGVFWAVGRHGWGLKPDDLLASSCY